MSFLPRLWASAIGIVLVQPYSFAAQQTQAESVEAPNPVGSKEALEFFEAKIRPVLIAECYECHSQQASAEGKLRGQLWLDTREGSRQGGESGPAVVPNRAEDSLILSALRHESFEMPPKGKLADSVIADFERWIEMGAADPRDGKPQPILAGIDIESGRTHWAFQPLHVSSLDSLVPQVNKQDSNPVDRFIAHKQQETGLVRSPRANTRVLVRRAWFDLLGIPPTPDEMRYWTEKLQKTNKNEAPTGSSSTVNHDAWDAESWDELIQTLLKRPEYGERWARHWMDITRFAESHGYEQDYDRPNAYHYRDFLIRAFNSDMPFDQFVQWQIAGDELAPNEPLAWMATGMLGAGAFPTQLTEAEFESARYDELDDMVSTTSLAFLGLSVGCARCHDHKFDPITAADYYRFAANFTEAIRTEKELDLSPEANALKKAEYESKLTQARQSLAERERTETTRELTQYLMDWKPDQSSATWHVVDGTLTSSEKTEYKLLDDGSFLAASPAPAKETIEFVTEVSHRTLQAIRVEALADPSLPNQGPGRAGNGNFALGNIELFLIDDETKQSTPLPIKTARATFQQNDSSLSILASIDSDPVSGWAVDGQIGKSQAAVFYLAEPAKTKGKSRLKVRLVFQHPNAMHIMGRIRISWSELMEPNPEVGAEGPSEQVIQAIAELHKAAQQSSSLPLHEQLPSDWKTAFDWFKLTSKGWREEHKQLVELEQRGPEIVLAKALVTSEGMPHLSHHADDRGFPHFYPIVHLLRRGDVHQKVQVIEAGFPQVLVSIDVDSQVLNTTERKNAKSSYRRAGLAGWMTDTENGAGNLVARVIANRLWQHHFGRGIVGTPNDFGLSGDKPTHPELLDWLAGKLIVSQWRLSELHRLIMTSETYLQGNKSLGDARTSRDPENQLWWHYPPRRLEAESIRDAMLFVSGDLDSTMYGPGTLDSSMRRRSIYFFIKRSQLIPEMMLFDWPEHLVSIGQRSSTTIAPQALMFMNSPIARSRAESFARRAQRTTPIETIQQAYGIAFGREPQPAEIEMAQNFLEKQAKLRRDRGEADADFQSLADLCQLIFSMNEFIYID